MSVVVRRPWSATGLWVPQMFITAQPPTMSGASGWYTMILVPRVTVREASGRPSYLCCDGVPRYHVQPQLWLAEVTYSTKTIKTLRDVSSPRAEDLHGAFAWLPYYRLGNTRAPNVTTDQCEDSEKGTQSM